MRCVIPFLLFIIELVSTAAMAQSTSRQPVTSEQIVVSRVLVDTRVTEPDGEAITGLARGDFEVRIDGKAAAVESAEWIAETGAGRAPTAGLSESETSSTPAGPADGNRTAQGRLLIFLFQTDFGRANVRVGGQMHVLPYTDRLLEGLEAEDRVAVFSYDSHLKFRLDFSSDHRQIADAIRASLSIDEPPSPPVVPMPRLATRLDRDEMRAVATPEKALTLLANALGPIAGNKSLILFGWGLGHRTRAGVVMGRDYTIARSALESARVTCFSLDITAADSHDLAGGLATAAADSGGFYASTYNFPQLAVDRLQKTLIGHYELEVRKPAGLTNGAHTIEVRVPSRRRAIIMARSTFADP